MKRLIWSLILLFSMASFVACKKTTAPPKKRALTAKRTPAKRVAPAKRVGPTKHVGPLKRVVPAKRAVAPGIEGTFIFDKKKTVAKRNSNIASLPKKERVMARFVLAIVSQMKMSLKIKAGGVVEATTSKPPNPFKKQKSKPIVETNTGTWKKDGDAYLFTTTRTERKRKKTQVMKCTLTGTALACEEVKKRKPAMAMVLYLKKI